MSLSAIARTRHIVSAQHRRSVSSSSRKEVRGSTRREVSPSPPAPLQATSKNAVRRSTRAELTRSTSAFRATALPDYPYRSALSSSPPSSSSSTSHLPPAASHQVIHDANNGLIYDAYSGPSFYNGLNVDGEEGPVRMLMFGKPGAGKGTLSGWMTDKYNIESISTGDLVRAEISRNTPLGQEIASTVASGAFVSDNVIVSLVVDKLNGMRPNQSWILDGFPRTLPQGELLSTHLSTAGIHLTHIIALSVPSSAILARLSDRLVHVPSGRVYNLSFNPPVKPGVDDVTGEPLERRQDDKDQATVERRLREFDERTKPLLKFYQRKKEQGERGPTVWDLSGENSEVNWGSLQGILEGRLDLRAKERQIEKSEVHVNAPALA